MEVLGPLYGAFLSYPAAAGTVAALVIVAGLYLAAPLWLMTALILTLLVGFHAPLWAIGLVGGILLIMNVPPLRAALVSSGVLKLMKALNIVPAISETERVALEAGVVWSEAELFSGKPDIEKLMAEPYPDLTPEEQRFINETTAELCELIDDWKIWKERKISDNVMQFIKDKGFLGMIIPKEYGGLGFSAKAHSEVIARVATRSTTVAVTIMVPNSLGPAELLTHYGTQKQKDHYLPRLAKGLEMPCFGLTEPTAGSDAGAIISNGVLYKGEDGEIYIRLNWNKRWITLAAISSVIGLAFKLRDPENLLGKGEEVGITCALIPSNAKGVVIGRRHDPLSIPFYNCPTQGHDVVVKAEDAIIGGITEAGNGWKLLMESLGAGRGISLPAQCAGGAKMVSRVVSAHASIRKQFGLPIGKFEGVEEPIARIAGITYILDAFRNYTLGGLDQGIKPPVVTAMAKYHATEMFRSVINDGMDVVGGAGITLGPRNLLALPYFSAPVGITVEGANILTRTLMVFGQGALRAHPYAFAEVDAISKNNLPQFDRAFWGHIGHIIRNLTRAVVLSVTRAQFVSRGYGGELGRYFQKLQWSSAAFAIFADVAMGVLGGKLKVKEKLTGRFADILSWMYMATAVLRRYKAEGERPEDLAAARYALDMAFERIQTGFDSLLANFSIPGLRWFFTGVLGTWSRLNRIGSGASDQLSHELASQLLGHYEFREHLTNGVHIPNSKLEAMGRLEHAYTVVKAAEAAEAKIKAAIKSKVLPKGRIAQQLDAALAKSVISADEHQSLKEAEAVRLDAIQVDDFSEEEYLAHKVSSAQAPRLADSTVAAS